MKQQQIIECHYNDTDAAKVMIDLATWAQALAPNDILVIETNIEAAYQQILAWIEAHHYKLVDNCEENHLQRVCFNIHPGGPSRYYISFALS